MKNKQLLSPKKVIISLVILYIAVLIVGFFLAYLVTLSTSDGRIETAYKDLSFYEEHASFSPGVVENDSNNFVYDVNGNCIASELTLSPDSGFNWDRYFKSILHKADGRDYYYTLTFSTHLQSRSAQAIVFQMSDGNYFVFFKEYVAMARTVMVMFLSVTMTMILLAILLLFVVYKNQYFQKIQREYVDNISHELKSPLSSIRALTETMNDGLVQDVTKQNQYYGIILSEVNRLEKTVSSMLELSKIQSKQIDCSVFTATSTDIFSNIVEKYQVLCDDIGIRFELSPDLQRWPMLNTNPSMVARIMDILLNNAVKFTEVDGLIRLRCLEAPKYVIISVSDSGSGVALEDAEKIFERFYKGDKSHNEKGSGLGLSIARELALSLHEEIWMDSTSEAGTEFRFTIKKAI